MASVDFKKLKTSQQVKAIIKHCDREKRKETNHSNEDINKNLIDRNIQYKNSSYESTTKKYDERIAYLDSLEGQNKRKDRVTCFGLEIPCPADLSADQEANWLKEVNKIICGKFKPENVLNMYLHRDEKHEYRDSETNIQKISRDHIHCFVIPEIDGKLNGKEFSSKKNMIQLNDDIQKMTQEKFGVDFMDGSKKKSRQKVSTLKNKSKQLEMESKQEELTKTLTEAKKLLEECQKQHQQLLFMSSSYQESYNSTFTQKRIDEQQKKLDELYRAIKKPTEQQQDELFP